jgi:ergothioneine biosynthesis glutamate--cysteine ligase EgtA
VTWLADGLLDGGLTEDDAEAHVHGICFKTGPPRRLGVELEWLVRDVRDPGLPVPADRIFAAVADLTAPAVLPQPAALPSGSLITFEPGGQLELSSAPADSLGECVTAVQRDMATLRDAMRRAGLALHGYGFDPLRPPQRVLDLPRYAAMEEFFDRDGPWGREMMCSTASVQVCLDAGRDAPGTDGYRWRWRLAHDIGPVLVAAFANSPLRQGRPSGWRSTRQQVWGRLDPGRTQPPKDEADPRAAWAAYSLDAELMCVRRPDSPSWTAPPGLTFRGWLRGDGERPPTKDDLTYHLSTLFPPVRPRGHLELRMIDAQPGDGWIVPAAVASALFEDPRAADAAMAATEPIWHGQARGRPAGHGGPVGGKAGTGKATSVGNGGRAAGAARSGSPWLRAARSGLADPVLARASQQCFEAADAALARANAPADIRRSVAAFAERYVLRRRCPADDQLEGIH